MQNKETSTLELINLLKTVEPTLKKEAKTVMLVDSSASKKSSKNEKKKKDHKSKGRSNQEEGQGGNTKRHLLPLWLRWSLEEELQSLSRVLEDEGIECPIYFKYVCH